MQVFVKANWYNSTFWKAGGGRCVDNLYFKPFWLRKGLRNSELLRQQGKPVLKKKILPITPKQIYTSKPQNTP